MSHELRTPLNSVIGFSQLLQMESDDPDVLRMLGHINNSGQHLLNLIDEILDISRIESGRVIVTLRAVALDELDSATAWGSSPCRRTNATSTFEVGEVTDALVRADQQRLRQVLLNLLSNAIKYNRPNGRVIVETEIIEDVVRISVRDTGLGISPEMVERLFIPFDRLNIEATGHRRDRARTRPLEEPDRGDGWDVDLRQHAGQGIGLHDPTADLQGSVVVTVTRR